MFCVFPLEMYWVRLNIVNVFFFIICIYSQSPLFVCISWSSYFSILLKVILICSVLIIKDTGHFLKFDCDKSVIKIAKKSRKSFITIFFKTVVFELKLSCLVFLFSLCIVWNICRILAVNFNGELFHSTEFWLTINNQIKKT